jgi:hypothetical protein
MSFLPFRVFGVFRGITPRTVLSPEPRLAAAIARSLPAVHYRELAVEKSVLDHPCAEVQK